MAKYLDQNGVLYFWAKIKALFVRKEDGKGLSTNDYDTATKTKVDALPTFSSVGAGLTINGGILSATGGGTADAVAWENVQGKPEFAPSTAEENVQADWLETDTGSDSYIANKPDIPTDNSQLLNGAGYQTSEQVQDAITTAIGDIVQFQFDVVEELPTTGEPGFIYLLSNTGTGSNVYDEYIWTGSGFEKIGTTEMDLSDYLQVTDVEAITNAEIDAIVTATI